MKRLIEKLFFFLTLMMVSVVGKGQNWTWTGENPVAGNQYYVYNVEYKKCIKNDNSLAVMANATVWTLSDGYHLYDGSRYYIQHNKAGLIWYTKSNSTDRNATLGIDDAAQTSGAKRIRNSGEFFTAQNENGSFTHSSKESLQNNWFFISTNQKKSYDEYIATYNEAQNLKELVNLPADLKSALTTAMEPATSYNNSTEITNNIETVIEQVMSNADVRKGVASSNKIVNPEAEDGTNGWTSVSGALGVAANGSFEVASWGKSSASITQTITDLPNGYYVLQASQMVPVGNTVELWGNNSSNTYTATTQEFRDLGVVCQVTDGTLTIKAVNNSENNWSNFDHFTLTYYGDADPGLTYEVGEKIDGTYLNQQPVYTGADETKTALLVINYINNYTNDPKHAYGIVPGAQATVVTSKSTQKVDLKPDPTPYNENSFAIFIENFDEEETYRITIPAGSYGYIGEQGGTNDEIYLEAVQSPLHDGKYFVVVKGTGKHVSRGKGWGTQAILDYYGVPMTVQTSGQTIFRFLDSNAFMGSDPDDDWMYTDKQTSEVKKIRRYILVPGTGEHEGEYMFYNPIRKKYLYYATPKGESYDAVFEGDEGAWFQFEALDDEGYAAHLANIEEDEAIRVAARAGFVVQNIKEYNELIKTWEKKGYTTIFPSNTDEETLTQKYFEKKNAELACDAAWEGTPRDLVGGEKVSLNLAKGLYVMDCDAFQQAMNLATLQANQGFRGLTYMYVKVGSEMYKSQLKSITETNGTIPTDEASAITALDAGTYRNQVIFYVPADGTTVEFGVENPQRLGNGVDATAGSWVAFKNIKVEKFVAELAEANLKCRPEVYGTFIAPFDVIMPDGITAYSAAVKDDQSSVLLTKVAEPGEKLSAKTPVILKNKGTELVDRTYRDVSVLTEEKNIESGSVLTGFYVAGYVPTGAYVLQDQGDGEGQKFYKVSGEDPIMGVKNRCYLNALNSDGSAKVLRIEFADEETAIENLTNGAAIVEYYSVNGSKLSAPQKGINLVKMSDSTVKKIFVK